MMRNYTDAQCHLGSFHNINNKSAFGIDSVCACAGGGKTLGANIEVKESPSSHKQPEVDYHGVNEN